MDSLIHDTAVVYASARIGVGTRIGPYAVVEEEVKCARQHQRTDGRDSPRFFGLDDSLCDDFTGQSLVWLRVTVLVAHSPSGDRCPL